MLRQFRTRSGSWLATVLLVVATLVASNESLRHGSDDVSCDGPVLVPHDASAHAVRSASGRPASGPAHCAVCHWARSLRPVEGATYRTAADSQTTFRAIDGSEGAVSAPQARLLPARAPPA